MAVESVMLALGTSAPAFALRDVVNGQLYTLDSFARKSALLVMFMRIAYISLPLGEGPFRSLSLALLRAIGVS